jgi:hypothetical protein
VCLDKRDGELFPQLVRTLNTLLILLGTTLGIGQNHTAAAQPAKKSSRCQINGTLCGAQTP